MLSVSKISSWRFISRSFPFYFSLAYVSESFLWHSEKDGNQVLNYYWINPIHAIKRYITKKRYAKTFYTRYEPQFFGKDHSQRAFSRSNSGTIFQAFQLLNPKCSPVLALFYADASFSGQHMTHHPIYSKCNHFFCNYFDYMLIVLITINWTFTVCCLNLHEDKRSKPSTYYFNFFIIKWKHGQLF